MANIHSVFSRPLRRDIIVLLCVKAVALLALYLVFFGPTHSLPADAVTVSAHVTGSGP